LFDKRQTLDSKGRPCNALSLHRQYAALAGASRRAEELKITASWNIYSFLEDARLKYKNKIKTKNAKTWAGVNYKH